VPVHLPVPETQLEEGRGIVADGSMGRSPHPALAEAMRTYQVALDVFDDAVANKLGLIGPISVASTSSTSTNP
jgi:hypothetical protein